MALRAYNSDSDCPHWTNFAETGSPNGVRADTMAVYKPGGMPPTYTQAGVYTEVAST